MNRKQRSFTPETHRRQTQIRLIVVGFLILVVVGGGLVWLIYGGAAAITAVLCLSVVLGLWVKEDEP
jgi:hypothetical protein